MYPALDRNDSTHIPSAGTAPSLQYADDLHELGTLARRFRKAHARLNEIELELHDSVGSANRLTLLSTLEEARMEYSDARFALSTRDVISSRR